MDESSLETPTIDQGLAWPYIAAGLIAIGLFVWRRWFRLSSVPDRPVAFAPIEGLALFLVMYSMAALGALAAADIFNITPADDGTFSLADIAKRSAGAYVAQGLVALIFVWLVIKARKTATTTNCSFVRAVLMGVGGILIFFPIFILAGMISGWIYKLITNQPPDMISHTVLIQLIESPGDFWFFMMAALVLIGAPIMEEILYRGILQEIAIRMGFGRWLSIFAVSVIFTIVHIGAVSLSALPTLFIISLGFGWVYEKSGRLSASIVTHSLFNLTNILLATYAVAGSA